jgi:drug/metabolite transporter (DMT)-like permease
MAAFTILSANALRFLPAGSAAVIAYSTPLWVAPAAALLLRERIGVGGLSATVLGLAGVAALASPALLENTPSTLLGVAMLLLASMAWAAVIVFARQADPHPNALLAVCWQSICACLILVPAAVIIEGTPDFSGEMIGVVATLFVGVIATALAFIGTLWLSSRVTALTMSVGMLCVPVVSIALSAMMIGEAPDSLTLFALVCIIVGVAALTYGSPRSPRQSTGANVEKDCTDYGR